MSFEHWLAFAAASAVLLAIPGPIVALVVSYALGRGRRTALAAVTGVVLGDIVAMTASLLFLCALMTVSPGAFALVKGAGLACLVLLVIRVWRAPAGSGPVADNDNLREKKPLRIISHAFAVTAVDPKGLVIFVAFLPQFMSPKLPLLDQVGIFEGTFVALSACLSLGHVFAAERVQRFIRRRSSRRVVNRGGRTLLISAGTVTAGYRKIAA